MLSPIGRTAMLLEHPRRSTAAPAEPSIDDAPAQPAHERNTATAADADHTPASEHDHPDHHLHVVSHATGKRHLLHDVLDLLGLVLVGLIAWVLWPASLGGSTHIIVVQGHSMEPVFHLGDAIVVKENEDPQIGDIIVFKVPSGEPGAGSLVVHRVVAFRPDGTITTRGDNRTIEDPFHIARGDVMGTPSWTLPHVGRMIGLASSPWVVGGCIGLLSLLVLLPGKDEEDEESGSNASETGASEGDAGTEPSPPKRVVDPEKVERRRKAMAELVPRRGRRLARHTTTDSPSDAPVTEMPVRTPVILVEGPAVPLRISPAVAERVRSLSQPATLELPVSEPDEFDDLLSRLGPDA